MVRAVLYPVHTGRPRIVLLPVRQAPGRHPEPGMPFSDDVDVGHWFPHGCRSVEVANIPGTSFTLRGGYSVVSSAREHACPVNVTALRFLGVHLRGNVVVFRRCRLRSVRACNVHSAERGLIDLVVQR